MSKLLRQRIVIAEEPAQTQSLRIIKPPLSPQLQARNSSSEWATLFDTRLGATKKMKVYVRVASRNCQAPEI